MEVLKYDEYNKMCDSSTIAASGGIPVLLFLLSEYIAYSKLKSNSVFDLLCCIICLKSVNTVYTEDRDTESGGNIKVVHVEAVINHERGDKV